MAVMHWQACKLTLVKHRHASPPCVIMNMGSLAASSPPAAHSRSRPPLPSLPCPPPCTHLVVQLVQVCPRLKARLPRQQLVVRGPECAAKPGTPAGQPVSRCECMVQALDATGWQLMAMDASAPGVAGRQPGQHKLAAQGWPGCAAGTCQAANAPAHAPLRLMVAVVGGWVKDGWLTFHRCNVAAP